VASSHRRILGQKILSHRKRAEMSQEKLAEKAELSYKYLGEVERGVANISLDSMVRIAKALKIRVHDLTKDF
jgi:transcriptional regulator with XRE-family HTH domain